MFLKFFKKQLPSVFTVIILVGIASWIVTFINPYAANGFENYQMPLYTLITYYIPAQTFLSKLFAFLMIVINSIFLIQLNARFNLIKNRTYLPTLFYILICSGLSCLHGINPAAYSSFFIILSVSKLFASAEVNTLDNLFKSGFFVSIAALFYLPSVTIIALLFIGIAILNIRGLRPWLSAIAGFATPLFFTFCYYYFFTDSPTILFSLATNSFNFTPLYTFASLGIAYHIFAGFLILLVLISITFLLRAMGMQKIIIRKYYNILLWLLFGTLGVMLFSVGTSIEIIIILAIPLSFILSFFFNFSRNRFWSELLFIVLIAGVLSMQLFCL